MLHFKLKGWKSNHRIPLGFHDSLRGLGVIIHAAGIVRVNSFVGSISAQRNRPPVQVAAGDVHNKCKWISDPFIAK